MRAPPQAAQSCRPVLLCLFTKGKALESRDPDDRWVVQTFTALEYLVQKTGSPHTCTTYFDPELDQGTELLMTRGPVYHWSAKAAGMPSP